MLDIKKNQEGSKLEFVLEGRLDTITAPQLEEEVKASIGDITELVFDFNGLAYVSSAGLRVLLSAQKTINEKGSMVVKNVSDEIQEIFDVTGFSDILTIE
jgi:anti-sigma B factor antagonist